VLNFAGISIFVHYFCICKTFLKMAKKEPTVRKAAVKKQEFTDEQIAMKAYEIYQARLARGDHGDGDDDWHKAVEALRKGKK
jgi:hypothetical protein